jgi:hypothetical protein
MRLSSETRWLRTVCPGVLAALLAGQPAAEEAAVQVYECHQGGKVTFSEEPCVGTEQTVTIEYSRPDAAQVEDAAFAAQGAEAQAGAVAQAAVLDTEILNLEQQITNQQAERDARVAALRQQLAQGSDDPNPSAWQAAMNQQIDSTYQNYNDAILAERRRLDQLQAQRESLGGQGQR